MPNSILDRIVERKRREVARRRGRMDLVDEANRRSPADVSRSEQAIAALRRSGSRLPRAIAEIKTRSPSAGVIRPRLSGEIAAIARAYEEAGAAAVSVLCDGPDFGGNPLDVRRAAHAVALPLLFKEFVIDPSQVTLARRMGAHMVLLVARILKPNELSALAAETSRQGLAPVVEVWDEEQLETALDTGAPIIGVNARDLSTFRLNPEAAARLVGQIPENRVKIHMSGIASREDLLRVADTPADAVLIGEALMRAPYPGERLREILEHRTD